MAQANFLKSQRNVDMTSNRLERNNQQNRNLKDFRIKFQPSTKDQQRLGLLFEEELKYYNHLVTNLGPMARNEPERILSLTPRETKMFLEFAYTGFNVKKINPMVELDLPEPLQEFDDVLQGRNAQGKRILSDRLKLFLEIAGGMGKIHPQVRKAMAKEVLELFQNQAQQRIQSSKSNLSPDQELKNSLVQLEKVDRMQKRHVQIPRSICKLEWDPNEEETVIRVPYMGQKLTFPGINLKNEHWNILLLHQEPGDIPKRDTPWVMEFKKTNLSYDIHYLDSPNPRSAFQVAKSRSY